MPVPSDDEIRARFGLPPEAAVRRTRSADGSATLPADTFTVVELESSLEGAAWDRPVAVAGSTVTLSIHSAFVGEGSPARITLRDARGKAVGRGEAPMHRDRGDVPLEIDRRVAEHEPDGILCVADVELTELGLVRKVGR